MLILARVTQWLLGSAAMPLMIGGVLILAGNLINARRTALIAQGEAKCETKWELDILRQQRELAYAETRAARQQLAVTDVLNMELNRNVQAIERELDEARKSLSGADERCLSDRVRDMARGVPGQAGSKTGGKAKQ